MQSDNRCVKCGASLRQGVKFCTACGAPVEAEKTSSHPDTPKIRRFIPFILVGIGILSLVILVVLSYKGDKKTVTPEIGQDSSLGWQPSEKQSKENEEKTKASDKFFKEGMKKVKAEKMEEAASLFEKAAQANPNNFKAWNNMGLALRKIDKKEEAVKAYKRAIEVNPDFALAYKNLGIALEQMNNKKEAAKAYLKYYELNPSASDAQIVKEKADMLMGKQHGKGIKR